MQLSVYRTDPTQIPKERPSFWEDVGSSYKYQYLPIIRSIERLSFGEDEDFVVTNDMLKNQPFDLIPQLIASRSENEFNHRIKTHEELLNVKEELGINNSFMSALFAGVFDPINLIPVPLVKGVGFARGVKRGIVGGAGVGTASELLRAPFDSTNTGLETTLNIGGATFFGGLLGGGIGHYTARRSGKAFAEQSAIDDGMPETSGITKTVVPKGGDAPFTFRLEEDNLSPVEKVTRLFSENNFKRKEDVLNLSNKDLEARPADSFGYAEKTLRATPYGRTVTNYKSTEMLTLVNSISGDGGIKFKTNESGISLMPNGSVLLNKNKWNGIASNFEMTMQNLYLKQFGIEDSQTIATQNVPFTIRNLQSKFRKDVPKPEQYFEDVGEYVNREMVDPNFKPKLDTAYDKAVKEGAEEFKKIMQNASDEGYKVGFFNTFKSNNQKLESLIEEQKRINTSLNKLFNDYDNALKLKKPTGKLSAQIGNMHLYNTQLRSEINLMEGALYTELKKIDRINKTLDSIIDKAVARKTKAQSLVEDINLKAEQQIKRKIDLANIRKELLKQAQEKFKADFDLFTDLLRIEKVNADRNVFEGNLKKPTLSDAQKQFGRNLWQRIKAYYKDPKSRLSKKQQEFFDQIDELLNKRDGLTDAQYALLKKLLKQIKQPLTPNELEYASVLKGQLKDFDFARVARDKDVEDFIGSKQKIQRQKPNYFTRIWNIGAIIDEEQFFRNSILQPWFKENPSGTYAFYLRQKDRGEKVEIDGKKVEVTDEVLSDQLNKQIDETYANIISNAERQNIDNIHSRGLKKIQLSRDLTIPNYKLLASNNGVANFIENNAVSVMRQYMNKFGPTIEMTRMFGGDRNGYKATFNAFNDVIEKYGKELDTNTNAEIKKLAKHRDDLNELTNVILNRIPEGYHVGSTSNRLVRAGMNFATITMMGSAALASLADPAKVILARGFRQVFGRYINSWISDVTERGMLETGNKHLTKVTGEGLEVISGAGMSRVQEVGTGIGEINNRKLGGVGDKVFEWLDKTAGRFYNLNLLNHWTAKNKRLVMPMAVDRIIRVGAILSNKYKGSPEPLKHLKADQDILLSYGLTKDDLKEIYRVYELFGGERKARGKEIYYDNSEVWAEARPDLFRKYVAAIRADTLFTIITPTEADKPLLSHGIFKGSRWSKSMKDRQHNVFKPAVQFMSWAFGANNKIVISGLQGRHQGYFSGMMAMFAMGMMSDYLRNPEWWKYKSTDEKIIKAVEYSGLTAYLLDITNFAEVVSNNAIGLRPLYGAENPFTGKTRDQVSELGGPLGSILSDAYGMLFDDSLEQRDQVRMIRRMIPFNNLLYTKWLFNMAQKSIQDPKVRSYTLPQD